MQIRWYIITLREYGYDWSAGLWIQSCGYWWAEGFQLGMSAAVVCFWIDPVKSSRPLELDPCKFALSNIGPKPGVLTHWQNKDVSFATLMAYSPDLGMLTRWFSTMGFSEIMAPRAVQSSTDLGSEWETLAEVIERKTWWTDAASAVPYGISARVCKGGTTISIAPSAESVWVTHVSTRYDNYRSEWV